MAITVKTSELFKQIAYRYYPIITIISLPSCYIYKLLYFPDMQITSICLLMNFSSIYLWLDIILALHITKPVGTFHRLLVMIISYLIGSLILYLGFILYFSFHISPSSGSMLLNRLIIVILMFGFYIIGTVVLVERSLIAEKTYVEEKTERLSSEKQLIENQLNLQQARVEPQFLFTIMDSISDLLDTAPQKAKTIQMHFIQYLRSTLVKTREPVTTVKQEMELIRSYLDIMKIGMNDRLEYQIEIDPQSKDLPFPSMLIQPIVENAINNTPDNNLHGGLISISVEKLENTIRVKTTTTGKGYKEKERTGYIIEDVKERLKSLFGDKGRLSLEENKSSGISVIIEVPCG